MDDYNFVVIMYALSFGCMCKGSQRIDIVDTLNCRVGFMRY